MDAKHSVLDGGRLQPRLDGLAAITPERKAQVRAASDRLQMVAHHVVVVGCTLSLQFRECCGICQDRVRTNWQECAPPRRVCLHLGGTSGDPTTPAKSNDGERDGPSSRAPKAIFVLLLHFGRLKDRKRTEIDFPTIWHCICFFAGKIRE